MRRTGDVAGLISGLLVAGLLVAGLLAGCGGTTWQAGTPAQPAPPASPVSPEPSSELSTDGRTALLAVVDKLAAKPYNFEFDNDSQHTSDIVAVTDPVARTSRVALHGQGNAVLMLYRLSNTGYQKVDADVPIYGGKYFKLNLAKLKRPRAYLLSEFPDPTGMLNALRHAVTVSAARTGYLTGTTDLTGVAMGRFDLPAQLKALGARARAVPFTVLLGDDGNIDTVELMVPAAGGRAAATYELLVANPGDPPDLARPAAKDVLNAPSFVYDALNQA